MTARRLEGWKKGRAEEEQFAQMGRKEQTMSNEVMTIEETASFLRVSKNTVYEYVRCGVIPARKIGRAWRLSRIALEEWLSEGEEDEVTPELAAFIAEAEKDAAEGRTITVEEYAKKRGIVL